jgi:hypothetical protein
VPTATPIAGASRIACPASDGLSRNASIAFADAMVPPLGFETVVGPTITANVVAQPIGPAAKIEADELAPRRRHGAYDWAG